MRALIQACPDAGLQDLGLGLYLILDCALDFRLQILIADFRLRISDFRVRKQNKFAAPTASMVATNATAKPRPTSSISWLIFNL